MTSGAHFGVCLKNNSDSSMIFARSFFWCWGGGGVDILHRTDVVTVAALVNKIWRWSGLGYLGKIV